jgi:hypothetical protein
MKNRIVLLTSILALIALTILAYIYWLGFNQSGSLSQQQKTLVAKVGDECAGIADNSVANMTALVEFQKLEIQGRKMNVMRRCMADKGFMENPSWLAYAAPIAQANALKNSISSDESIENLRREHMMLFNQAAQGPVYWVHRP